MRMIPWAALPVCDHDGRFRAAPKTDLPVCRACITQAIRVGRRTADAVQRRQAVSTSSRPDSKSSSCPCIALTPPSVTCTRRARAIRTYPVGIARERARTGRLRATYAARTAPSCTHIGPQMHSPQMHSHDSLALSDSQDRQNPAEKYSSCHHQYSRFTATAGACGRWAHRPQWARSGSLRRGGWAKSTCGNATAHNMTTTNLRCGRTAQIPQLASLTPVERTAVERALRTRGISDARL